MQQKIIILDFGSQTTQLIARRLRELDTFCEILPYNKFPQDDPDVIGVILAILSKNDNQGQMDGMAIAGLILSIIAFIVGLSSLCFYIYCFITDPEFSESVRIISNQLLNGYLLS